MLERSSRFILEVFPYLSAALITAVIVPGYLYSQAHGFRAVATPTFHPGNENALEVIHRDHAAFADQVVDLVEALAAVHAEGMFHGRIVRAPRLAT